ncbi:hypothetical protein [Mesomycoplasma ovipneumoniae]|uniref:hypothetical protein n=1 Tax=Mesomycoplasma ovipneumoniae TaxID=29562 RepID=UPI000248D02A|nr:hypothetical protein [Mesomycoplasma ovipneumoniae]
MKKQQQNLSPYDLVAKEIVSKYDDYKKLIKEDFHNQISHIFKNLLADLKRGIKPTFRLWKKQKQKWCA